MWQPLKATSLHVHEVQIKKHGLEEAKAREKSHRGKEEWPGCRGGDGKAGACEPGIPGEGAALATTQRHHSTCGTGEKEEEGECRPARVLKTNSFLFPPIMIKY